MDRLWTPWRLDYVKANRSELECVFCLTAEVSASTGQPVDAHVVDPLVVHLGRSAYVILNRYPYNSGHLMVAPYAHVATLEETDEETVTELMLLTRAAQARLKQVYRAPGFNLGMNIGASAGAGIAGHIHMHVLPRWPGDVGLSLRRATCRLRVPTTRHP